MDLSPEARKSRSERVAALIADPNTIEVIYEHVANGGTLIDLCETWDVRYSEIIRFIDADEARQKKYRDCIQARNEWSDEMLLAELRALTQMDIRKLYYPKGDVREGQLKDMVDLDSQTAKMIHSVEVDDIIERTKDGSEKIGETKKVKLWDKLKALEMKLKNRRLLVDKIEHEGTLKLEDLVGRSMETAPAAALPAAEAPPHGSGAVQPPAVAVAAPEAALPAPVPEPPKS